MVDRSPLVSVVIPVYNAEEFIINAVNSVVSFSEVGEVVLVEDGSYDESYQICLTLSNSLKKVKLFTHENRINLGASSSRNLGIVNSSFPFIAFLDADDYFLENRFDQFSNFVFNNVEFDGIYEPVKFSNGLNLLYGISESIPSQNLFHFLIRGTYGHFHTNGLIVKRSLLIQSGLFVQNLELHQDSDLWLKLAFYGKLIPGSLTIPVAMVRKHDGNRIWKGISNESRLKQWKVTWSWAQREPIGIINRLLIFRKIIKYKLGSIIK